MPAADPALPTSIADVLDAVWVRGSAAGDRTPSLLLEVPHGATRTEHFVRLRQALRGDYPADLVDFFHVNTDVGAPELAVRTAERFVAARPDCSALVLRCRIPRTFVDCNRVIEATANGMTPGLHAWVREDHDRDLLLARYRAYRDAVARAFAAVCDRGGTALMVHSYAPRSIDVPVDDRIVERLRAAYAPGAIERWPLRPAVDLIHATPEGESLASPQLLQHAERAFAAAGFDVARNATYPLHPSTLAAAFARAHPGRTLCLELRRDLLVPEFTPFAEMAADAAKVDRAAAPLCAAVLASMPG